MPGCGRFQAHLSNREAADQWGKVFREDFAPGKHELRMWNRLLDNEVTKKWVVPITGACQLQISGRKGHRPSTSPLVGVLMSTITTLDGWRSHAQREQLIQIMVRDFEHLVDDLHASGVTHRDIKPHNLGTFPAVTDSAVDASPGSLCVLTSDRR